MFKVGDKVKIKKSSLPEKYHKRIGDFSLTYEIKEINDAILVTIFNNYHTWNVNIKHLELDCGYYRKMKIKKICSKLVK